MTPKRIKGSPALKSLVEKIQKGQCVLFLGAGINIGSTDAAFPYPEAERPLQARELAKELIKGTDYKKKLRKEDYHNLTKTALLVETSPGGRGLLIEALKKHLGKDKHPSHALRMLACMPFSILITTNYDNLLEQALAAADDKTPTKLGYNPKHDALPQDVDEDPTPRNPLVFKMHGDLGDPRSIVITDDDYINFIQRMSQKDRSHHPLPETVLYRLQKWPTLFIGYSLQDYNLRLLFRTLRWRLDRSQIQESYSVDLRPDPLILSVWQERHQISFFKYDLWHFIPWLHEQVMGQEYRP
jgi:hypothetical protein